uniref:General odorant-binding protein 56a-like protein n=1 Tax=Triatoma infestans TaxID=30076 RepID=A0A170WHD2_TRIIF
MPYIGLTKLLF